LLFLLVAAFAVVSRAPGAQSPLTVKEISLMLRSGYSANSIMADLSQRRFADTFAAAQETQLIHAGATPELLIALKSGTYNLSPEDAARAKQENEAKANHRLAEAAKSREFNTLYQSQLARERAAQSVKQSVDSRLIYDLVKGDLVQWRNGVVTRFDDSPLEKKTLFLLYFSAHWCGPCRKFTPGLVNFYNEMAPKHPELELIFVSLDKSPFNMEVYMRDTNMPWPAIDYQKIPGKNGISHYAGEGIPDLVLVDAGGKVLSDSYQGKKYLGPEKVLTDLNNILTDKGSGYAAASR
jgi:nucleoredoxin